MLQTSKWKHCKTSMRKKTQATVRPLTNRSEWASTLDFFKGTTCFTACRAIMIGTFRLSIQHQSSRYPTQVDRLTQRQRRHHFKSDDPQQGEFSTQQGAVMGMTTAGNHHQARGSEIWVQLLVSSPLSHATSNPRACINGAWLLNRDQAGMN